MENFYLMFKILNKIKYCYAYGAYKGILFISIKIQDDISFIVEGGQTAIPIVSFNEIDFYKNAVIIIFAWNFADDIIRKLKENYKVSAKAIIPLPSPRVVDIC